MSDLREAGDLHEGSTSDSITYKSNTSEVAMRITTKGQVTIPLEVRERLGLLPHTEVEFTIRGNTAVLTKATERGKRRGRQLIQQMRGRGTVRMSTDEILALTRDANTGARR
jgi:AbrB family looped-hinge helix DNA binding protein